MLKRNHRTGQYTAASLGQAILEFSFAVVVFVMLAYGLVAMVRWGYKEMGNTRKEHDKCITSGNNPWAPCPKSEQSVGTIFQ